MVAASIIMALRRLASLTARTVARPAHARFLTTDPSFDTVMNMTKKLEATFGPDAVVQVEDTSGGCGSFYRVAVASAAFAGTTRIKQHRLVQDALKSEIAEMHGLTIETKKL